MWCIRFIAYFIYWYPFSELQSSSIVDSIKIQTLIPRGGVQMVIFPHVLVLSTVALLYLYFIYKTGILGLINNQPKVHNVLCSMSVFPSVIHSRTIAMSTYHREKCQAHFRVVVIQTHEQRRSRTVSTWLASTRTRYAYDTVEDAA